jgi:hypothetical protein
MYNYSLDLNVLFVFFVCLLFQNVYQVCKFFSDIYTIVLFEIKMEKKDMLCFMIRSEDGLAVLNKLDKL